MPSQVEDALRRDLLAALDARRGLLEWIPTATPGYVAPTHLGPVAAVLEGVLQRPQRAIVSTPPRHGKTTLTLHAIAWLLKRKPTLRLAYVSYSESIALSKSREARWLAERVGINLAEGSANMHEWRTNQGGGLVATGVGGSLTGRGFDVILVDDVVKDRQEADSELIRQRTADWWRSVLFTRLDPGASVIVIGTRWHEADLLGTLATEPGWEVINLPAIDDQGRPLWPERFSALALAEIRRGVGSYVWEALYQGRPSSPEGGIFKRSWLKPVASLPEPIYTALSVDSAWKTGVGADFSVIETWTLSNLEGKPGRTEPVRPKVHPAIEALFESQRRVGLRQRHQEQADDSRGGPLRYDLRDVWRERVELPGLIDRIARMADELRPNVILIENSSSGIGAYQVLKARTRLPLLPVTVTQSKTLRAELVSPLFEAGLVRIAEGPWNGDFIEELCGFPSARHDDQVDACSMALAHLQGVEARAQRQPGLAPVINIYGR